MYSQSDLRGFQRRPTAHRYVLNLVFVLAAIFASLSEASGQTTLSPVADTDTQSDNASGTNTVIYASQYNHLFVRFDMNALSGTVTDAKLRMYQAATSPAHTLNINTTSTDVWTEGGTKPAVGSLLQSITGRTTAGWVEVDITSHVQSKMSGNKIVSLGLTSNIGNWTHFYSRQNATNKPELVVTTSSPTVPLVEASATAVPATVDGNLNESFWNVNTTVAKAISGTPNNSASFGAAWDATYLYVGVNVTDAALHNDSPASPWEDDAIEIYIDANNNKGTTYDSYDRQIIKVYNSSGIWEQNSNATGIVHATAAVTGGYSAEVAIPWTNLGITAEEAVTIGFDVGINDDDNGGVRESQLLWNGNDDNWQNTSAFGSLRLVGDGESPSVPTGLTASNVTETSFRLSWEASTDNVGVTGYEVFRDGIPAGTTSATFLDISGLTASTSYSMTVRARDAAANWSAQSSALSVATGSTSGTVDANNTTVAATVDGNLNESFWNISTPVAKTINGTPNNSASFGVAWDGTYLYVGVDVADAALYSDTPASPWEDDAIEIYIDANNNKGTTYDSYDRQIVKAYNTSGIWEQNNNTAGIIHATTAVSGGYSVEVAIPWSNLGISPAAVATIGFDVGVNDDDNGGVRESQLLWNGNDDNWQNTSAFGSLRLIGGGGDLQAPTVPTDLTASNVTQTSFRLSWTASSDNVGVTGYEVFRDGTSAGTTTATFMDLSGLTASTTYSMTVRARDAAANWSAQSNALPVTTTSAGSFPNTDSPLGMNLSDIRYYATDWPFVNLAKSGDWRTATWGSVSYSSLTPQGYLPVGTSGIFIVVFDTDTWPHGSGATNYVYTYTGTATISVIGGGTVVSQQPGRIVISIPSGFTGDLAFEISNHTAQLGNFRVTEASNETNPELFRQSFLDQWKYFGWIRFMDWMHTNDSEVETLADYPSDNTLLESTYGAHFSTMVALCNELNANPWITIPHRANDAFVTSMANYFKDNLSPGLKMYVEYSNECWNFQFQQAHYCHDTGVAQNLDTDEWRAWMKFYAKRSAEVHTIFENAFGVDATRVVGVVAWQSANSGQCNQVLGYYNTYKGHEADALAVAPYFGGSLGGSTYAGEVVNWDLNKLFQHLDPAFPSQLSDGSQAGRLAQSQGWMNSNATVAQQHGARLIAYEGGQHLVGVGATWQNNTTLQTLFNSANRDSRMKGIYLSYLDMWKAAGGEEFAAFASCGPYSKYGSWGAKEHFTQTRMQAPKYDALLTWIENNPASFSFGGGGESLSSFSSAEDEGPSVYPNPSFGTTSVTFKNDYRGKIRINLYSTHDKKISLADTEKVSDDHSIEINTSGFRKGVYLMEIQSGENRTTRRLVIR